LDNKRYRVEIEEANVKLKKTLGVLEEDLNAGRLVQAQLSPASEVEVGGYHLCFNIKPSLYLSGDYVDYFKITEDNFVFYLADVSGHGASSAFVTVLLKSFVNQIQERYFSEKDLSILQPKVMLSLLSQKIHAAKLGKYLTIVYAVLNLKEHTLKYSIGGHFPNPILYNGTDASYLPGKGFPVGIMPTASFEEFESKMSPDGRLVIFSDGILEILNLAELPEKESRLLELVKNKGNSVTELFDELKISELASLPDDVTCLLLKRLTQ
jgi:sigma-B regulation protein RsbU (phosphoserine phosphatase)